MDRNQARFALLKIALVVLAGMSWISASFVLSTRPEDSVDPLSTLVRLPASLPAQIPGISSIPALQQRLPHLAPTPSLMESVVMDVIKVPCWDKNSGNMHSTTARWVRLTGKPCESEGEAPAEAVLVRNMTNGYVATVFATQGSTLTTDYIPLKSGKNDILIRFTPSAGVAVESQFSFVRE
jgi:hypothetical protein